MNKPINLIPDDRSRLMQVLLNMPLLANERGRESIIASASLEKIRPLLDLSGPPATAIPLLVEVLRSYGRVSYDQHALGRFLSAIAGMTGMEEAEFLRGLITKYSLMVPAANTPELTDWKSVSTDQEILEKIIGENTLRPIAFLQQGIDASRSVAYVEVCSPNKRWSGTGFLVSPRLLLTNQHVLPDQSLLTGSRFRFNFQLDVNENPEPFKDYKAKPDGIYHANKTLDYTLIELDGDPGEEWGILKVRTQDPLIDSRVNIIQHPNGLPKQIAIQNNFIKYVDAQRIQYLTSTLPGSSGAPVLNDQWEVIALHHAGGWLKESDNGPIYYRNEGITIQSICLNLPIEIRNQLAISDRK
jgi:V8-like Glu-specific endopeptidase